MLNLLRNIFSDKSDDFIFRKFDDSYSIAPKDKSGLYIHIPFCKNVCPYCPYVKVKDDDELKKQYKNALLSEIKMYNEHFGRIGFSSLYFGGGTPTLMLSDFAEILECVNKYFTIEGDIALETSPDTITPEILKSLNKLGFNMLSLGIQSLDGEHLRSIGRKYNRQNALVAIEQTRQWFAGHINADLIFAIRDQTLNDVEDDLSVLVQSKIEQITCYPLFTFPFSEIGKANHLHKLKLPDPRIRKKMYYFINDYLGEIGYERTNVWSFSKDPDLNYSSVTRNFYLGLGASSGSYNGSTFYFNTFSVPEYIEKVKKQLPISLAMRVSDRLQKNFWLYWQFYTTSIDKKNFEELFDKSLKKDFGFALSLLRFLKFVEYENEYSMKINTRGAHWIHLLQNNYALDYVNKIWSASKKEPWPLEVRL